MKFFLLLLLISLSFSVPTEGGNISADNVAIEQNSSWFGLCGILTTNSFSGLIINATPSEISFINLNASVCPTGISSAYLLFSNSTIPISNLSTGNLSLLDDFIQASDQSGSATFLSISTFAIPHLGIINNVPTTYTHSSLPGFFALGYLNDQNGNLVFATPLVIKKPGYNGSLFDFQLMLPTKNKSITPYYLTIAYSCSVIPSGGGGSSGTKSTPPIPSQPPVIIIPPVVTPPINQTPIVPSNETNQPPICYVPCPEIIKCSEWSECGGGYTYSTCFESINCVNTTRLLTRVCPTITIFEPQKTESSGWSIPYNEICCCLSLLLLLLLLLLLYRRKKKEDESKEKKNYNK